MNGPRLGQQAGRQIPVQKPDAVTNTAGQGQVREASVEGFQVNLQRENLIRP